MLIFLFQRNWPKKKTGLWTLQKKAIEEYKKFVYLCCILPDGASPSETVDKVWHMHLMYTQNYWEEFCPEILKRKLHHHPSKGGVTEKVGTKNGSEIRWPAIEKFLIKMHPKIFGIII
ncbi:hypothetical protein KUH03_29530 [Sphingobacterium sp. E70]|uniref:glycine-rich domain-containing protein n=1 Tax=Sphingobacterium sp. E70 TaxID=2853439 RepID=UPI00211BCB97|nr:hypothetical protein [Sphingobacterium sp. E70]ULT23316.1 hypothetical protein KUH03_29530 [Sphingobacterium sp. E70]